MTLMSTTDIKLSDKKTLPITAALLTDHKLISLGLPSVSGAGLVILTDVYYGHKGMVQLLSSNNEWDILFLGISYQKMSDMKMVTKVISEKTTTAVVIVAPIYNQDEERIYKKEGAKAYIMECSGVNNNCELINAVIEDVRERRMTSSKVEKDLSESSSDSQVVALFNSLSPCEKKVIKFYLKGLSVTEIASINRKSIKTISGQKQSAMKKLGLDNSMAIFRYLGKLVAS